MNEQRLEQLRDEARQHGAVVARGVDISGGPIPRKVGYYGEPVVRPPVWTWEIPLYFFIGGIAGMSAVISLGAALFHHVDLARMSILMAVIGAIVSPILLILDLGRPRLFINMLRVFKPQSAMSMGAWILTAFGACVFPAWLALELNANVIAGALLLGSALFGVMLATYTGVLLGATVIPAWFTHRVLLPVHFGAASLGSAAALLELLGFRIAPLNALGFIAAGGECAVSLVFLLNRHGAADCVVHKGRSGWMIRTAKIFTGPLSLVTRAFGFVPIAALVFLAGALMSRFGWIGAGKISGRDPQAVFASQVRA